MSFQKKGIFLSLCLILIIIIFIFISRQEKETLPQEITLAHDKGIIPVFQRNFELQGQKTKELLGIGIKPIPSQTTDLFIQQMNAGLPTKEAPDLFTWWSTFRVKELVDKDFVGELTDLWDKHKDEYPKGLRDAFTLDGKVYGFPHSVNYWPVWYNKKIFERLGLKEPGTWKEFYKICETLKASGIKPILSSLQDRWPAFIWFEEMIIGEDPELYEDLCLGKAKYSDPRVKKAFHVWANMIKKGYFTEPSANLLTNAGFLWNNEKFGMVLCGTWYYSTVLVAQGVDEKDIGAFILPSHNSDAGNNIIFDAGPIFTAKQAENPRAAKKIVDWWMGPDGNGYFANLFKAYPGNLKSDISNLPVEKKKLLSLIKSKNYRVLNRYWEATPTPICEAAVDKFAKFILNPDDLDKILLDLDQIADEYWLTNKEK